MRVARTAMVLLLPVSFGACEWFTDFKTQPAIEPWEPTSQNPADTTSAPRGQPMYSVPIQGTMSPAFGVSYAQAQATLDSLGAIANPTPIDGASLERGRKLYQINCAVCHSYSGAGGPSSPIAKVNPAYGFSPPLRAGNALTVSDGYIYGMIRNGRGSMPSYNRIEELERWDIVNYIRALQGRAGTPADTTPAGYPGQNGPTVPGPSLTAPTRSAPFVHPGAQVTPGSSGINSATFKGHNDGASKEKH
jgi:mono/diheme cytochrome c family protein